MAETVGIVFSCLLVALVFPAYSEKIFAITGATAVCIVCYVIPVALHLKLRASEALPSEPALALDEEESREVQALLLPNGLDQEHDAHITVNDNQHRHVQPKSTLKQWYQFCCEVVVPVVVVLVGVSLSLAALFTTCSQLIYS